MMKLFRKMLKLIFFVLNKLGFMIMPVRNISCLEVSKNMSILSHEKKNTSVTDFKLDQLQENPLVILLAWMMASKKHTLKYADIWIQKGFDVLTINVNPWQFLWPVKGTQVVAADILKFLEQNKTYSPLMLHGFSVGGYLWGEVMVQMAHNMDRYQHILDRIVGQVWDSAADVTEIHKGVPPAVFPKNKMMARALGKYMLYHLKTFDKVATRHYIRSSQMFHTTLVHAPALFLLSKTDTIGTESSNRRVKDNWESMGIPVDWKIFEKSPHVGHFRKYPKEYTNQLHSFLDTIDISKGKLKQKESEENVNKIKVKQ
ncbi:transmembrane protein 53 isoform X2 [Sitophilus oryzae]|uniref:Transmembrane protein 53 isoform X2 n=1 Tax=Sitophilus oryzae TaxID=7048 RepID=A0A6J2YWZ4_SITOR|nr:transmembrane protein 53 isoform X2 [Sitophilus oryzae]